MPPLKPTSPEYKMIFARDECRLYVVIKPAATGMHTEAKIIKGA